MKKIIKIILSVIALLTAAILCLQWLPFYIYLKVKNYEALNMDKTYFSFENTVIPDDYVLLENDEAAMMVPSGLVCINPDSVNPRYADNEDIKKADVIIWFSDCDQDDNKVVMDNDVFQKYMNKYTDRRGIPEIITNTDLFRTIIQTTWEDFRCSNLIDSLLFCNFAYSKDDFYRLTTEIYLTDINNQNGIIEKLHPQKPDRYSWCYEADSDDKSNTAKIMIIADSVDKLENITSSVKVKNK